MFENGIESFARCVDPLIVHMHVENILIRVRVQGKQGSGLEEEIEETADDQQKRREMVQKDKQEARKKESCTDSTQASHLSE